MAFQIIKETTEVWRHSDESNIDIDLLLSDGYFRTINNNFELYTQRGGQIRAAELINIEVIDETDVGAIETFATILLLVTRLKALNYSYF